jgi:hypothetical protein
MNLVNRAKEALWRKSGLPHDANGYAANAESNLVSGVTPDMIKADYGEGSGQEWRFKIRAIHSSAALAANTFGRWKSEPSRLTFAESAGFAPPKLEAQCPTGLRGTPPNLDVLLASADAVIGIESKLLEPLTPTVPKFSASYSKDRLPLCEGIWWSLLERVRQWPASHLDAAQLIKHYLGLRNNFADRKRVLLVYLYWKPLNASKFAEYSRHAEDLDKFRKAVQGSQTVRFVAMDYLELWDTWERDNHMAEHARNLKNRYCVEI